MFKLNQTGKIWGVVIFTLIFFFGFRECSNQSTQNDLINAIANYKDSAKFYSLKVSGMKIDVAYNQSLVLQNKRQLISLIKSNDTLAKLVDKYKNIKSTIIIKTITQIKYDTISVNIPCDFEPIKVIRDSMYYHFAGTISPVFFAIDSISIPNEQSLVIGSQKLGFLKGTEERAAIVNSNPLIKTTNIKSYVISKPKKIYETRAFSILTSLLGGYIIATQTIK